MVKMYKYEYQKMPSTLKLLSSLFITLREYIRDHKPIID